MLIPPNAQQVFSGILFDVYHWQQPQFDGTETTFEMIARQPSVEIIATVGDKIIIEEQIQPGQAPYISLPGGRIEAGEKPDDAIKREMLEETGYEVGVLELYAHYDDTTKLYFPEFIYIGKQCSYLQTPNPEVGEKITTRLISFDDFLQLTRHERFFTAFSLRFELYEALLDPEKKQSLKEKLFS